MAKTKTVPVSAGDTFELTITPSEEGRQAPALIKQAQTIAIVDKASHERGLELLSGWKGLKRLAAEHWKKIKQPVDQLKKNLLEQERRDIGPMDEAIAVLERKCLDFAAAERQRAERQAREEQQARERAALRERERQQQEAEAKATELESQSENLSARELWFVTKWVERLPAVTAPVNAGAKQVLGNICREAGYKDPEAAVERLLNSVKIMNAVAARRQAIEIRQQAAARATEPIDTGEPAEVLPQLGYRAGMSTRTYVSAEIIDAGAVVAALVARGELDGLEPVQRYLTDKAKSMPRDRFESAYPGARYRVREGIAG
jgi:hypothetical protein